MASVSGMRSVPSIGPISAIYTGCQHGLGFVQGIPMLHWGSAFSRVWRADAAKQVFVSQRKVLITRQGGGLERWVHVSFRYDWCH